MGHNILHREYEENVNKKEVQNYWDDYVSKEGWQEGASGLNRPIRWIDHICADREEAEQYIASHDRGWYDQLAVKFWEYPKVEPSKTLLNLKKRRAAEAEKYSAYAKAHSVSSFKAEFVGCPGCGSKLKRELLKHESCPLCRTELRSKTTVETLERYSKNICELDKQIKAEERKLNEKAVKKSAIKWLVKIEYHT